MDENNTMTSEELDTQITEITEADAEGFDSAFEDAPTTVDDDFDLSDGEFDETTAEQNEVSEAPDAEEGTETEGENAESESTEADVSADNATENKEEEGHQLYTLKDKGGEKQYRIDDVLSLAQKGMDYDGLRQDRDRLREDHNFLKELAESSNMTVEELKDSTRALIYRDKMAAEGKEVSEVEALRHVQRERTTAKETAAENEKAAAEQKRKDMISNFVKEFPNVNAVDIPNSVWDEAHGTGDLAGAYRKYTSSQKDTEIAELKAKLQKLETNIKNKERSTGSMKSAGSVTPKDDFDSGWDL